MPVTAPFRAAYAESDTAIAARLLGAAPPSPEAQARIATRARGFIAAIRDQKGALGGVEELLREYALSTPEGLALMALAEALLRVPDAATADRLIEDKLSEGDFARHERRSDALLVSASAWALGVTARLIQPGQTPESMLGAMTKRLGLPAVRQATRQAMRVMGNHFVLGQTIEEALKRAASGTGRLYRYSFDMLGEGARTARDAERYFASYASAITAIGKAAGDARLPDRPGISVKLSALHPRYEAVSQARIMRELVPRVIELARMARAHDLNFTVDAEEADRLELSLDVIAAVVSDPSLAGWDGFGLAIQAYQKRASHVIAWIEQLAAAHNRRFMVRLVKGAYWDTEVKRAQERGLDAYPVFTRKAMTDLNYEACARQLLAARPRLYPQFATHNALTVATIIEMAGNSDGYEFQRLHGMGEALYDKLVGEGRGHACRTYAPVGGHKDLLAYLVRRLLENGANSSFVSAAGDDRIAVDSLLVPPAEQVGTTVAAVNARLPLPAYLYGSSRANSAGVEIGHAESLATLQAEIASASLPAKAASLIGGRERAGPVRRIIRNPATGVDLASATDADAGLAHAAVDAAQQALADWSATPVSDRAAALRKAADAMENQRGLLIRLLQSEAGKTIDDAIAELREAVDFCRFYAAEAEKHFSAEGVLLPGPTGEENRLRLVGRGVFVAISPWNFPLAIFMGQIAAALAAGNTVVAKPAEQTPLIAVAATRILHECGIPPSALNLVLGDGVAGAALVAHPAIAGVVFTGSTEVARAINRALAAKDGPIVPLIAETGGINAMIVDATALPEQVTDDVIASAFRSAGQRCSALRLLCVQDEVADQVIEMIVGAARELKLGDPARIETHVGPVIDAEARQRLDTWIARMKNSAAAVHLADALPANLSAAGQFVGPHVFELRSVADLREEVFGPVLHVVRWKQKELPALLAALRGTGYGLTGGLHTRIGEMMDEVIAGLPVGNLYINRNIIGAVVGTQPFGGSGLSGTGPKAGGPHYLMRFASEQVITINTAAAGGNASLMAMGE